MSDRIGRPISRAEALGLARQILERAERERQNLAAVEAVCGISVSDEEYPENVCSHCGHVGDFWFDRTWEDLDDGLGESMHYRCEACGRADIPTKEKHNERLPEETDKP